MAVSNSTAWVHGDPRISLLRELNKDASSLVTDAGLSDARNTATLDLDWLDRAVSRVSSRFTIIVIGHVSSGKSSFINSLLGRKLLVPSDRPTDGVVSVLQGTAPGKEEYAEKVMRDGTIERCTIVEATRFLRQQETPSEHQLRCREVRLFLDEPWLRELRIVNTPGLGDRLDAFEKVALDYLRDDASDLVVWTFFPDAAANAAEVGLFHEQLLRRKGAVVGVVTRCLEGREDDSSYDPRRDLAFVGERGVLAALKKNLGQYLREIVLYDSHAVRRMVQRMRANPDLQADESFSADLRRSGYLHIRETLTSLLGETHDQHQEARRASLLKRCEAHAAAVASSLEYAERALQQKAKLEQAEIAAWRKVESEIVGPARAGMRVAVQKLAHERAGELVSIMGNSAADTITENFGLLDTLGRSLVSWTGVCDSAADALNSKIGIGIDAALEKADFHPRLQKAVQDLVHEHLMKLQLDLQRVSDAGTQGERRVEVDPGRPAGSPTDVLGDALSGALKGVVSAVLKSVARNLEKRAAEEAAKAAGREATKRAAGKAGEAAAKKAAGAGAARFAGVVTLVLVPFDIAKMVKDFRKGRDNLAETVKARYKSDRPTYGARIFDGMWPLAEEGLSVVLRDARTILGQRTNALAEHLERANRAASLRESLLSLEQQFATRTRE